MEASAAITTLAVIDDAIKLVKTRRVRAVTIGANFWEGAEGPDRDLWLNTAGRPHARRAITPKVCRTCVCGAIYLAAVEMQVEPNLDVPLPGLSAAYRAWGAIRNEPRWDGLRWDENDETSEAPGTEMLDALESDRGDEVLLAVLEELRARAIEDPVALCDE